MTVRPIELHEGLPKEEPLTDGERAALATCPYVSVAKGTRPDRWKLTDRRKVGTVRVGAGVDAVELTVRPKVPIARLMFLVSYARQEPKLWSDDDVGAAERPDLLPSVGHAFARAARRALRPRPLEGYLEVERTGHEVRGRIRTTDQLNRRYGLALPVAVRYDERSVDIAENQLLLAAARRLMALAGIASYTTKILDPVIAELRGVSALTAADALPAWRPTVLNARYHTALGLAELVLRDGSYEMGDDGNRLRVDGLVLTMWKIYEDFVTVALKRALERHGGVCLLQDKNQRLDHDRLVPIRPDLVYKGADGKVAAVVDAKYATERSAGGENPHLYQMLAYCTALGLDRGHLVYAKGEADSREHRIQGAQAITIVQHSLDLALSSTDLLAQVDALAAKILSS